ncbi:MAG: SDR family oxidoreductase [Thermogemmatispora sp.]|uniref:Oxidoreductase n=1 Tax=Thermogemmatispora tikiterensis TaxID=1825093 RepID=A0A328VL53_9CHLR|nr:MULTISPECIES: SDR family NAD(P)-dependent oxidoreductase [Thermogemmatispora]MBX5455664.1 SDR family oxidoreductase [Thermogemmatispora sp.]RAQ97591.1 oxidoreductase [Thermogemmatispora tikiterensis]
MSGRLQGKVAIITGTASGQGRVAALRFAAEGCKIVGCDLNVAGAEETVRLVREAGGEMVSLQPCNLSDPEQAQQVVELAVKTYGGFDILYNNAGTAWIAPIEQMTTRMWHDTLRSELDTVYYMCKAAWPHLIARGGGSIINVGSVSAKFGSEDVPGLAHAASKGAVIAMTRQLAAEGGKYGIRANTISPALIRTPQTEWAISSGALDGIMRKLMLKRIGTPEDVVFCAIYLASDEASWVTGADFAVDGGASAF